MITRRLVDDAIVATALCRRAERNIATRLQNLLLEFRRCINSCERVIFAHEDTRTSSAP